GRPFSTFYIGSQYPKPFLAPLRTAGGMIVTRRYPMKMVPGESRDHPHHRSLWIGYGNIDHVNFWENEPSEKANPHNPLTRGELVIEKIGKLKPGKKKGSIAATIGWQNPAGHDILRERRIMTFYADPQVRKLDIDSTLTAIKQATFADTKEGFFAIRVADSMNGKHGGVIRNSKGAEGEKNVWGKRADWATYEGTVDGQKVGIAILDNPQNYNHPPRWHARAYGLFAVNPFGVKAFDRQSATPGGYTMAPGQSLHFRYRVIVYTGQMPTSTVARWYAEYAHNGQ
ncbi:MAG: PmoA family protein, partial [Bryobacteraceae bacterium]